MSNIDTTDRTEVGANVVRDWARNQGYEVGNRGHLAQDLIDSFNRRHRKQRYTNKNPMVTR